MKKKSITVTLQELEGLPDDIIDELVKDKDDENKRVIRYFDTLDILVFSKNEELKQKLIEMRDIGEKNAPILGQIIEKREESANLMGF